jgi:hypothetical protein
VAACRKLSFTAANTTNARAEHGVECCQPGSTVSEKHKLRPKAIFVEELTRTNLQRSAATFAPSASPAFLHCSSMGLPRQLRRKCMPQALKGAHEGDARDVHLCG